MKLDDNLKVYVAGHTGLVGSAILNNLTQNTNCKIITATHDDVDLTNLEDTYAFFDRTEPDVVICAAAKVGGIMANSQANSKFLLMNTTINTNILEISRHFDVKKFIFLGSSCIYPKKCNLPITEEQLLSGYLEPTNEGYALSKILGVKLCHFYNQELNENRYISLMPCNLYGPNDNYHMTHSHVFPKFIRIFNEAKKNNVKELTLWGSGKPYREFLHSTDLANAVVKILETDNLKYDLYNVGYGSDITIRQLAEKMNHIICDDAVALKWDTTKPDGTFNKLMDCSRMFELGWKPTIDIDTGIKLTSEDYNNKVENGILKEV